MNEKLNEENQADHVRSEEENSFPENATLQTTNEDSVYGNLSFPQDFSAPQETQTAFKELLKQLNIPLESAQQLVDFETDIHRRSHEEQEENKRQIVERWAEESKKMFGANCAEEISFALRAADTFGGAELRELLQETGLGNHPVILRTLSAVGKAISEDVCLGGKPAAPADKTFSQALYGK